jgi:Ca2+-binding RTX toxin-like protein
MAQNDQNDGLQIQVPGMDQFKDLKFLQSETNPTDLVVQLPDGSEVVFPNYIALAQAGAPPEITLEDGTVVPGQEIVSLIDNLNYDLIAPAAGNEGEAPNGGGAAFSDLELDPDDDIGHGPYANQIEISDEVGFGQYIGYLSEDESSGGGGGGEVPEIDMYDNDGDNYVDMYGNMVGDEASGFTPHPAFVSTYVNRPVDTGPFNISLETVGPSYGDWDGISIYLRAGETITVTQDQSVAGEYFLAIDNDFNPFDGNNPIGVGVFGWEYTSSDGSISYTATADGLIFVGTGFPATASELGSVFSSISIDSSGTIGDAVFIGGDDAGVFYGDTGSEVFVGGGGDDTYTGGTGSDRFVFADASTDGDDLITDFQTTLGALDIENDVIDLDALFDSLGVAVGDREVLLDTTTSVGDTILTIGDGSGGAHAGAVNFSITLDGVDLTGFDDLALIANGNLEVT